MNPRREHAEVLGPFVAEGKSYAYPNRRSNKAVAAPDSGEEGGAVASMIT